jgi:hypothetical protein
MRRQSAGKAPERAMKLQNVQTVSIRKHEGIDQ